MLFAFIAAIKKYRNSFLPKLSRGVNTSGGLASPLLCDFPEYQYIESPTSGLPPQINTDGASERDRLELSRNYHLIDPNYSEIQDLGNASGHEDDEIYAKLYESPSAEQQEVIVKCNVLDVFTCVTQRL